MQALGEADKLSYGTTLEQLLNKLPMDIKIKWGRYAYKLKPRYASIVDFDAWLEEITAADASVRQCSTTFQEKNQTGQHKGRGPPVQQRVSNNATSEDAWCVSSNQATGCYPARLFWRWCQQLGRKKSIAYETVSDVWAEAITVLIVVNLRRARLTDANIITIVCYTGLLASTASKRLVNRRWQQV